MTLIIPIETAAPKTDPTSQYSHLGLEKQPPGIQATKASFQAMLFLSPYTRRMGQAASQVTAVNPPSQQPLPKQGRLSRPRPGLARERPSLALSVTATGTARPERGQNAALPGAFGRTRAPQPTSQGYIFEARAPSSPGCCC